MTPSTSSPAAQSETTDRAKESDTSIPMRADARRNRDQIIAAAKSAFVDSGLEVPMDVIARTAGVGVGTLYRRFPDRRELVAAVAAQAFRGVVIDIETAASATDTAWDTLASVLANSTDLRLTVELAFRAQTQWPEVHDAVESQEVHRTMMAALEALVVDAQAEGSMRTDVGAGDALMLASIVLATWPSEGDPLRLALGERALRLVLDGLATQSGSVLPGAPISVADLLSDRSRD